MSNKTEIMINCCNIPMPSMDCCSPIDWNKSADLIKYCGFRILPSVIETIRTGKCEAVTIGFAKDGTPIVEITERGCRKRTYRHDNGKQAEDLVKKRIKKFYGETDKPLEPATPEQPPQFIRPGINNPFE